MNLKVLRPADGVMMKLVKYSLAEAEEDTDTAASEIYHNHYLDKNNISDIAEGTSLT